LAATFPGNLTLLFDTVGEQEDLVFFTTLLFGLIASLAVLAVVAACDGGGVALPLFSRPAKFVFDLLVLKNAVN
jgi:hypothetical protein